MYFFIIYRYSHLFFSSMTLNVMIMASDVEAEIIDNFKINKSTNIGTP